MTEIASQTPKPEKKKREYNRKPEPPAPPAPPSAAVSALEADILTLVQQRLAANTEIANATQAANTANARVQAAQANLTQLQNEVNYRLDLISRMKGESPTQIHGPSLHLAPAQSGNPYWDASPPAYLNGMGVSIPPGVGSIPPPAPRIVEVAPRVRGPRTESALDVRDGETGARAI